MEQQTNVEEIIRKVEGWCKEHKNLFTNASKSYLKTYCNNPTQENFNKICFSSPTIDRKTFGTFLDGLVKETYDIGENAAELQLAQYNNGATMQDNLLPPINSDVVGAPIPPIAAPRGKFFQQLKHNKIEISPTAKQTLNKFIQSQNTELFNELTTLIADSSLLVFLTEEVSKYAESSDKENPNYHMDYRAYQEQNKLVEQVAAQDQLIIGENQFFQELTRNEIDISFAAKQTLNKFIQSQNTELFNELTTLIADSSLLVFLTEEVSKYAESSDKENPNYHMDYRAYQEQNKLVEQVAAQDQLIIGENQFFQELTRNEIDISFAAKQTLNKFIQLQDTELFIELTTLIADNNLLVFLVREVSEYAANSTDEEKPNYRMDYRAYQEQNKLVEQAAMIAQERLIAVEIQEIEELVAQYPKTKPIFDKLLYHFPIIIRY